MKWQVLIAHAKGEEDQAELLAVPLRRAGYEVVHEGTLTVGDSVVGKAEEALSLGQPVVLCGTARAVGSTWARRLVHAARVRPGGMVYVVRMDDDADVSSLAGGDKVAAFSRDRAQALRDLVEALKKSYPLDADGADEARLHAAEQRYRELALESCDIIDLANLPENDYHIATRAQQLALRRLYVALRVRVEVASGREAGEAEFAGIETRRLKAARGEGPPGEELSPVGARLAEARRLVVLGDPGAGKTTLLRWLATAYLLRLKRDPVWRELPDAETLPDEDLLPIIVRCRELDPASVGGVLDDLLRHTLRRAELSDEEASALRALLRRKLERGEAILLLDGLDEITDPPARARFCKQIETISAVFPKAPVIATSRVVGYREMGYRLGRGFEHVMVAELTREDKDEFARRWCELVELPERREAATRELIHDIHSSDRIERLTGNPMLLTTMALVKRKVGRLPSRRADLYWSALEVLLNWRREVDAPVDDREAVPQLEYVAYAMCERGVQQLNRDEITELFERMREEYPRVRAARDHTPEEFLRLLEARTGLLVEAGSARHLGMLVPVYEFRHLTFQEYLAARALVDGRFPGRESSVLAENVAPLAARVSETEMPGGGDIELAVSENWREALRLCVATCRDDDVDDVLLAILNPLPGEDAGTTARPRAVQAVLCLADEPNADDATAETILRAFVSHVTAADGTGAARTSLDVAALTLATSRWGEALRSMLVEAFRAQVSDFELRERYGSLAGMMGGELIPQDEGASREWLAGQASRIQPGQEADSISAALNIMEAAYSGKIRHLPAPAESLVLMLDESPHAAHAKAWALYWLNKTPGRHRWKPTPQQLERLVAFISDPAADPLAATFTNFILGNEKEGSALEPLLRRLEDKHYFVRKSAAEALGNMADPTAVEGLIARLNDEHRFVREASAGALGKIGDARAVEPLIATLGDSDAAVRRVAVSALGRISDARAAGPLVAMLEDEEADVRLEAARTLGDIGDARAVEPLVGRLDDDDADVVLAAVNALASLGDPRAVPPLISMLEHPDGWTRAQAATALGNLGDARAVEPLIASLGAQDTRSPAAVALGEIGGERALEALLALLDTEDGRGGATAGLGRVDDPRAFDALLKGLSADDEERRRESLAALSQKWVDGNDRRLLSVDLDGIMPFLDVREEISEERVAEAAERLQMTAEEVRGRYEALAGKLPLKLAWRERAGEEGGGGV